MSNNPVSSNSGELKTTDEIDHPSSNPVSTTEVIHGWSDDPVISGRQSDIARCYREIHGKPLDDFASSSQHSYWVLLLESRRILGIACLTHDYRLLHIGVVKYWRRRHIGSILLKTLIQFSSGRQITFEIPPDNLIASMFFNRFRAISVSPHEYIIDTYRYKFPWSN